MSDFMELKTAIQIRLDYLSNHDLYVVDVDKDKMWETYLNSFPEGTNPIFRERTEHDCQCCKQFIRAAGAVVAIINNQIETIWDIKQSDFSVPHYYMVVAGAMDELIRSHTIKDVFIHDQHVLGTDFNIQMIDDRDVETIRWDHFYFRLDEKFVHSKISLIPMTVIILTFITYWG